MVVEVGGVVLAGWLVVFPCRGWFRCMVMVIEVEGVVLAVWLVVFPSVGGFDAR